VREMESCYSSISASRTPLLSRLMAMNASDTALMLNIFMEHCLDAPPGNADLIFTNNKTFHLLSLLCSKNRRFEHFVVFWALNS